MSLPMLIDEILIKMDDQEFKECILTGTIKEDENIKEILLFKIIEQEIYLVEEQEHVERYHILKRELIIDGYI
jgi:hypothetical protein